jgi:hypothetical protein
MAEQIYEMFMKLGIDHAGAMAGLGAIGARLVKLAGEANVAKAALMGLGGMAFGGVLVAGIVKALETAKEFSKEMTALRNLGTMNDLIASGAMDKKIFDVAKISGMKVEDVAKIAGFAASILNPDNTMMALQGLSRFAAIQTDKVSDEAGKALQNVIRAGMITGRITDSKTGDIDMGKLDSFLNEFQRLKAGTHGAFNENTLLAMAKQGGGFLRGLSTEGMEAMAVISQSLGGPRAGTAFLGIYEQLARGQMTGKTARGMEEAGLLKPGDYDISNKGVVTLDSAVSKALTAKFGGNPLDLAKEIRESLIAKGITDPQEQMRITANAFGRQTTRRFMAEEIADYNQMVGEGKRLGQGAGVNQAFDAKLAHDMEFNLERLQNAWHNMMVAFADPQSDTFILVLQKLRGVVVGITDSIRDVDPKTLTFISEGIVALGVALGAAGMVAVIAAIGPTGWLIGGFAALAALNWDKLQGLAHFVQKMSGILRSIDEWSSIKIPGWMQWNTPAPAPTHPPDFIEKQSFRGDSPFGGAQLIPANFNPGGGQKITLPQMVTNLNIDGRQFAIAISEQLEEISIFPIQAPSAEGLSHFRVPGARQEDT